MRMNLNKKSFYSVVAVIIIGAASCSKDPNSPGYEYMPDMYRSPSVEAYVDYAHPSVQSARVPASGTIPFSADKSKAIFNFPYPFPDSPIGYEQSALLKNPIPYSTEVMEQGKKLYGYFCTHCHGENGDGQGQIVLNGKLTGVPAYNSTLKTLPEGKMFHSITYGKNLMGSHAGQLNKEERWKIVHYVKFLQNDGKAPDAVVSEVADSTGTN